MKILIVDDHAVVRQGIKQIISEMDGPLQVAEAGNGSDAIRMLREGQWDMVLLDINLPGKNGIEILKQIKAEWKKLPVLMLSMYSEEQYAMRAIRSGASGYMTKETAPDELLNAINKVMHGGRYISAEVAEKLVFDQDEGGDELPHHLLSDREYEVLRRIASGHTVSEIAEQLNLSVKTISTYRSRILEKMKMKHNAELTHYAIKHELVE
ncbi:MAG: response regulator transcription factor [Chromatiales bacterium]|nr:response regulator transcription factor [Chromatiales bacterium]